MKRVADEVKKRLPIWKEKAYLMRGSAGDIVADGDSVDRRDNQICLRFRWSPGLVRFYL